MKNRKFFYQQYDLIDWRNQEKTKINDRINRFIIRLFLKDLKEDELSIFDIGFGIGFFLETLIYEGKKAHQLLRLGGCEPSLRNYRHFKMKIPKLNHGRTHVEIQRKMFQDFRPKNNKLYQYVTAIYVFPHFLSKDLDKIARKIHGLLEEDGKFILVLANERYIKALLRDGASNLFIEKNSIKLGRKSYGEVLHYSEIPKIGTVVDYNRDESYYEDFFKKHGFHLDMKKNLNDGGFVCTIFIFSKKSGRKPQAASRKP